MYIEKSPSLQHFAHSFTTCQVLNTIASYEYQNNEHIQVNVKHHWFIFQHVVQIYLNTYPIYKQVPECLMQKKQCWLLSQLLMNS